MSNELKLDFTNLDYNNITLYYKNLNNNIIASADDGMYNLFYDIKDIKKNDNYVNLTVEIKSFNFNNENININKIMKIRYKRLTLKELDKLKSLEEHSLFGYYIDTSIDINYFSKINYCFFANDIEIDYLVSTKLDLSYSIFYQSNLVIKAIESSICNLNNCTWINSSLEFNKATINNSEVAFNSSTFISTNIIYIGVSIERTNIFNSYNILIDTEIFLEDIFLNNSLLEYTLSYSFENNSSLLIQNSNLDGKIIIDIENLNKFVFENSINKNVLQIRNKTKFNYLLFLNAINQGNFYIDWTHNNVKNAIINEADNSEWLYEQFFFIKQCYNSIGKYDYEDYAYIEYMRYRMQYIRENSKRDTSYYFSLITGFICDYFTNPLKALLVCLFSIFLFGILYTFALQNFINAMYFSGITFFTVGYGDISAEELNAIIKLLTILEGFIGVTLISFFTASVVRKVIR